MVDIVFEPALRETDRAAVLDELIAFNRSRTPYRDPMQEIGFLLKDADGRIEGGLTGYMAYGWLFIELLFVPEKYRGQGIGSRLMADAERVAREAQQTGIYLDTFSFQAPDFYQKLGYGIFGQIGDFPRGETRYSLSKVL